MWPVLFTHFYSHFSSNNVYSMSGSFEDLTTSQPNCFHSSQFSLDNTFFSSRQVHITDMTYMPSINVIKTYFSNSIGSKHCAL